MRGMTEAVNLKPGTCNPRDYVGRDSEGLALASMFRWVMSLKARNSGRHDFRSPGYFRQVPTITARSE